MARKIVAAIDGSDTGFRVVKRAAGLAAKLGHDLCLVHVLLHGRPAQELSRMVESEHMVKPAATADAVPTMGVPSHLGNLIPSDGDEIALAKAISEAGDEILRRAKRMAEESGVTNVAVQARSGDPADEILDIAEAEGAEMIVLGRRGLGRAREMLVGSVSQKVLHNATCTVVLVQ